MNIVLYATSSFDRLAERRISVPMIVVRRFNLNLLSSALVHKCQFQFIKSIKYTKTIEHQGQEALTGVPVQKAIRYFDKGKLQFEQ